MATDKVKARHTLQPIRSISASKALRDINPTPAPHGVPTARWRAGNSQGRREDKTLAWYRGHHAGVYDAALTIQRRYPRVAAALLRAFGMNNDGSIGE